MDIKKLKKIKGAIQCNTEKEWNAILKLKKLPPTWVQFESVSSNGKIAVGLTTDDNTWGTMEWYKSEKFQIFQARDILNPYNTYELWI